MGLPAPRPCAPAYRVADERGVAVKHHHIAVQIRSAPSRACPQRARCPAAPPAEPPWRRLGRSTATALPARHRRHDRRRPRCARGQSARPARIACTSIGAWAIGCRTLGISDFIRVPFPAARMTRAVLIKSIFLFVFAALSVLSAEGQRRKRLGDQTRLRLQQGGGGKSPGQGQQMRTQ